MAAPRAMNLFHLFSDLLEGQLITEEVRHQEPVNGVEPSFGRSFVEPRHLATGQTLE